MPETENSLYRRADWNVCTNRAKYFSEARVSRAVGQRNAWRGIGGDWDGRTGSGGSCRGGDFSFQKRVAAKRGWGGAGIGRAPTNAEAILDSGECVTDFVSGTAL